jgi:hypothetical protein
MAKGTFEQFIAMHKAGTEGFNRGEFESVLAIFPEDAEWHAVSDDPEASVLRGPEEITRWFEGFREIFDEWKSEPLGYEELGRGMALVHHVIRGTSRGAGVPVEVYTWEIWELDTESLQPVRVRQFRTREEAMEVLGS